MDHEKTNEQRLAKPAIRGIDWNEIFRRRPDLTPPGYAETSAKLKAAAKS